MREGRVDLVCEVHWTETYTVMVSMAVMSFSATSSGRVYIPPKIPKRVTKEHKETYIHSRVVFLQDTRLDSATISSYRAS